MSEKIRIGIIGTGRIANRFVAEAREVAGVSVAAVYNPNRRSADAFALKHAIGHTSSDLGSFLKSVDAVYIASPHDTHEKYTEAALDAGRHVLCEKPMALRRESASRLYSMAHDRGLILLEAVKTAFCPGFQELCNAATSGLIGRIVDVEASFSKLTDISKRELQDEDFGGSFTELGSYVLLPAFRLLGTSYEEARFDPFILANGVDGYTKLSLSYPDGASATLKTGLSAKTEGDLVISGTRGYIYVPAPWWLTSRFEIRGEDPKKKDVVEQEFLGAGLRYEIKAFAELINGASGVDTALLEEESIARAAFMDGFLRRREKNPLRIGSASSPGRKGDVAIWAHRGASYAHPENTLGAFRAACELPGLRGVEMDVQRTADGHLVVFHDEKVDRIMEDATGNICDLTLKELKAMKMKGSDDPKDTVPTLEEFLDMMEPYCKDRGTLINIELKTSRVRYEGIEKETYETVKERGMLPYVIWSSFLQESVSIIKTLDPSAHAGMLSSGMCDAVKLGDEAGCDAYHVSDVGLLEADAGLMKKIVSSGKPVRAYGGREVLFSNRDDREQPTFDRRTLAVWGVTDIFTNVPERYLGVEER